MDLITALLNSGHFKEFDLKASQEYYKTHDIMTERMRWTGTFTDKEYMVYFKSDIAAAVAAIPPEIEVLSWHYHDENRNEHKFGTYKNFFSDYGNLSSEEFNNFRDKATPYQAGVKEIPTILFTYEEIPNW